MDHVYLFEPGMRFLHGPLNHKIKLTMTDKLFDVIRWVTTQIDRAGWAGFSVVFSTLYITMLMAIALSKCFWLTVLSFTKWPRFFA